MTISKDVLENLQLDVLISNMMTSACGLLGNDVSALFLVDRQMRELVKLNTGSGVDVIRIPITAGLAGFVATTGQTINIKDVYEDARFNQACWSQRSYQ